MRKLTKSFSKMTKKKKLKMSVYKYKQIYNIYKKDYIKIKIKNAKLLNKFE